jgi:hypothetical protein
VNPIAFPHRTKAKEAEKEAEKEATNAASVSINHA